MSTRSWVLVVFVLAVGLLAWAAVDAENRANHAQHRSAEAEQRATDAEERLVAFEQIICSYVSAQGKAERAHLGVTKSLANSLIGFRVVAAKARAAAAAAETGKTRRVDLQTAALYGRQNRVLEAALRKAKLPPIPNCPDIAPPSRHPRK